MEDIAIEHLIKQAEIALAALRSYQYGNQSEELAKKVADRLELSILAYKRACKGLL